MAGIRELMGNYDTRQVSAAKAPNCMFLRGFYVFLSIIGVGSLLFIFPSPSLFSLLTILLWFALPGIVLTGRMYRHSPAKWAAALLAGPACGYVLSSLVLLALWIAGVRSFIWLMTAAIPAAAVAWLAGALAPSLSVPRFTRRDIAAVLLSLLAVPAVVARPYARVGIDLPEGRAYRAYFTADFVWEMAVVSEVSKGDMPPRNPYFVDDDLHYYWLMHLLPAAEHRAVGKSIRIEQILLVNAFTIGLAFVGFFYFFVRHFAQWPEGRRITCDFQIGILPLHVGNSPRHDFRAAAQKKQPVTFGRRYLNQFRHQVCPSYSFRQPVSQPARSPNQRGAIAEHQMRIVQYAPQTQILPRLNEKIDVGSHHIMRLSRCDHRFDGRLRLGQSQSIKGHPENGDSGCALARPDRNSRLLEGIQGRLQQLLPVFNLTYTPHIAYSTPFQQKGNWGCSPKC